MTNKQKPLLKTLLFIFFLITFGFTQETEVSPQEAAVENTPPTISGIPGESIQEGKTFAPIKLDQFVEDPEDAPKTMRWTVTGNKDLQVSVSTDRIVTIKTPSQYWNGSEELTFTVTDPKGGTASEKVVFEVESVNNPPVIKAIPGQTIDEGQKFAVIKLDDFIEDPDHKKSEISWETDITPTNKKQAEGELSVTIDAERIATIVIPDTNWFGEAKITFTATDPEYASVKTQAVFHVKPINDAPVVQKAPDQEIEEKNEFESINLMDLVSDVDDDISKIKWSVSGGTHLKVSIDKNGIATVKIPGENWNGPKETFTFTATDPGGASASFTTSFTVKSVNDAPEFTADIADQTIDEKKQFKPIVLDKIVKDIDHSFEELKWTISGNKDLKVQIEGKEARILIPNELWNGQETIQFKVTDPEGASDERSATFTVNSINDIPVLTQTIPSQTIDEKKSFKPIKLDDFVKDPDHKKEELSWEVSVKHQGKEPENGTLDIQIDDKRIASVIIPDSLWNGSVIATFTATDPEGASVKQNVTFTVNSINDVPVFKKIPDQTIDEKTEFESFVLDDFLFDADHDISKLKITVSGEKDLKVSISNNREVTVKTPNELWNGQETITFTALDPEGAKATSTAKFTVKSINDPPVMKDIPSQTIKEKQTFKTFSLDDFVEDPDHEKSKLKWTVFGVKELKVSVNPSTRLVTVTAPNLFWNGEENVTFKVTDPEGASDERNVTFTIESVNDAPEFVKKPEDQTIDEKKQFSPIRLGEMIKDPDHKTAELSWTFDIKPTRGAPKGAKTELDVQFDEKQQIATVVIPDQYWHGSEEITFTATDPEGAKAVASAVFTVKSVNDAPVMKEIADQTIQEKESFSPISLAEFTNDPDHAFDKLKWEISGNKDLKVSIDKSGTASITTPNNLWHGLEKITFTVTDPEGASAKRTVTFTAKSVNDAPVMKDIKEQTIKEKQNFQPIALDNFVEDPDHDKSKLKWEISGNKALKVTLDTKRVATITAPDKYWNGSETLTFTVTDPEGAQDSRTVNFTIESINDAPEFVKKINDQTIKEKSSFVAIKLNELVKDADHKLNELSWSFDVKPAPGAPKGYPTGLSVKTDNQNNATIVIPDQFWNGSETITFTVTDPEGAKASVSALFTVTSVNDAPVLAKIPDQSIQEKESFVVIDLAALTKDPDHAFDKLKWTVSGNKDLKVNLDKTGKATITTPTKLWNGSEKITFTVTDPEGASAKQTAIFTVASVNDAPVMKEIPNQTIKEKQSFKEISLDDFVSDLDHSNAQLKWTTEGAKELKVALGSNRKVNINTPNEYWHGSETIKFTVTDPEGAQDSRSVTFTVQSVNDAPEFVKPIPNQTIDEKKSFAKINLDDFIKDPDHKKSDLTWTWKAVSAGNNAAPTKKGKPAPEKESPLKVSIDNNRVASIEIPDKFWNGSADITFTAKDPEGASAQSKATFTVRSINDLPIISPNASKHQKIKEGGKFTSIDLSTLATDPDHPTSSLQWTISGNRNLKVDRQKNNMVLVSVPNSQWFGKETITFTVTDPEGGKASHAVLFEVEEVNDPPVISKIPNQKIKEKGKFTPIKLDDYVKDPDNKPSELMWTLAGANKLKAQINPSRQLLVSAPDTYYNGPAETFTLTVKDPKGAMATTTVSFEITSVNDAPVMKDIPAQKIKEKASFKEIQLNNFVNDPDHKKEELKWTATVSKVASTEPSAKKPAKKPAKGKAKQAEPKTEEPDMKVNIDASNVARISLPSPYWHGEREITFTVTDPEGAQDSRKVLFTVESVNDIPTIKSIENQTIKEKEKFKPVDLSALVSDPDHPLSALTLTVSGNKQLKASINAKKVLQVSTPDKFWNGEERLTVTVTDPEGGKASQQALFKVIPVNDAPVIKGLKGQKIKEKEKFQPIDLSKVATDPDHKPAELKWTVTGNKDLKVNLQGNRVTVSTPDSYWYGKETLTFTVTDPEGASTSEKVTFEATPVNDPPVFSKIPQQTIKEKESFAPINLSQYVKDPDHKFTELQWTLDNAELPGKDKRGRPTKAKPATTKHSLRFEITDDGVLNVSTPNRYWFGRDSVTINVIDPAGARASETVKFVVTPVNDAPQVKTIEGQAVDQGKNFKVIKLDQYVSDPDHKTTEIKWTVSGNRNLDVAISSNREATVTSKRDVWYGKETVIFTATDPAGAVGKTSAVFEVRRVNAKPEIRKIPDYAIKEDENGGVIAVINLDQIARDRDHRFDLLKWTFTGNRNLVVRHDRVKNTLTVSQPYEHWNGPAETITFKVTDPEGASAQTSAKFSVIPQNDPPKAMSQTYQTKEGEVLTVNAVNGLMKGVIDPDNEKPVEVVLVSRPQNGSIALNAKDGSFTYTPNRGFYGLDEFTFKVKDPGGLFSSPETAEVNVSFKMKDVRSNGTPKVEEKKTEPAKAKAASTKKTSTKKTNTKKNTKKKK